MASAWTTAERTRVGQPLGRVILASDTWAGIIYLETVYSGVAIRSFGDKATEKFFVTGRVPTGVGWASVRNVVRRKLDMLQYAARLHDLKSPPGNRLEALRGKLAGLHSIRVNDQWRIVFEWTEEGAADVRVTDYH